MARTMDRGVASGPTKGGTPLMKLFKVNPAAQSEADRARDLRLTSIASRYRPRGDAAPEQQQQPATSE